MLQNNSFAHLEHMIGTCRCILASNELWIAAHTHTHEHVLNLFLLEYSNQLRYWARTGERRLQVQLYAFVWKPREKKKNKNAKNRANMANDLMFGEARGMPRHGFCFSHAVSISLLIFASSFGCFFVFNFHCKRFFLYLRVVIMMVWRCERRRYACLLFIIFIMSPSEPLAASPSHTRTYTYREYARLLKRNKAVWLPQRHLLSYMHFIYRCEADNTSYNVMRQLRWKQKQKDSMTFISHRIRQQPTNNGGGKREKTRPQQ